jgi:hypothetical protein
VPFRRYALWSGNNNGSFRYNDNNTLTFQSRAYFRFPEGTEVRVDGLAIA